MSSLQEHWSDCLRSSTQPPAAPADTRLSPAEPSERPIEGLPSGVALCTPAYPSVFSCEPAGFFGCDAEFGCASAYNAAVPAYAAQGPGECRGDDACEDAVICMADAFGWYHCGSNYACNSPYNACSTAPYDCPSPYNACSATPYDCPSASAFDCDADYDCGGSPADPVASYDCAGNYKCTAAFANCYGCITGTTFGCTSAEVVCGSYECLAPFSAPPSGGLSSSPSCEVWVETPDGGTVGSCESDPSILLQAVVVGADGSETYSWSVVDGPGFGTFARPNQAATQFTGTVAGNCTVQVAVTQGGGSASDPDGSECQCSATAPITVNPCCSDPVIVILGTDDEGPGYVLVGQSISLEARASDPSNHLDPASLRWSYASKPDDSNVPDLPNGTDHVSVTPDVAGEYVVEVVCQTGSASNGTTAMFALNAVTLKLKSVTFDGVTFTNAGSVTVDVGTDAIKPEWVAGSQPQLVCLAGNTAPDLEAVFDVTPPVPDGAQLSSQDVTAAATLCGTNLEFVGPVSVNGASATALLCTENVIPSQVALTMLTLDWSANGNDLGQTTNVVYVLAGQPTSYGVTQLRISKVVYACMGLSDPQDIVNALWNYILANCIFSQRAVNDPSLSVWQLFAGVTGACIDFARLMAQMVGMIGIEPCGAVIYGFVDPGQGGHASISPSDFTMRECGWEESGHDPEVNNPDGPHDPLVENEILVYVDHSGHGNNFEACFLWQGQYYAAPAPSPFGDIATVMNSVALRRLWVFPTSQFGATACVSPGPYPA